MIHASYGFIPSFNGTIRDYGADSSTQREIIGSGGWVYRQYYADGGITILDAPSGYSTWIGKYIAPSHTSKQWIAITREIMKIKGEVSPPFGAMREWNQVGKGATYAQSAQLSASPAGAVRPIKGSVWDQIAKGMGVASQGVSLYQQAQGMGPQAASVEADALATSTTTALSAPVKKPIPWGWIAIGGGALLAVLLVATLPPRRA